MNKLKITGLIALLSFLTGCVNMKPMTPNASAKTIDTSKESIVLVTLDLYRPDGSRYIPHPFFVRVQNANVKGNDGFTSFQVDRDAGKAESEINNKFWFRLTLAPGDYTIKTIDGIANAFPFIGGFNIPLFLNFTVPKDSVIYVGNIEATLRPRLDPEFRAGPVVPLIDQGVTGMSGGTFDVTIKDTSLEDLPKFSFMFPVLKGIDVKKEILPAWNRHIAQIWWENNGSLPNNNEKPVQSTETTQP